jgi:diaminopimelate epimerase
LRLKFTKMHGTGNDFIVIDCRSLELPDLNGLARKLCHRRFGIGADQMLLILNSNIADARMRILNADGTEVEMCGNGIRCIAKYIWERGISDKPVLDIETEAGIIRPEREGEFISVDMGEPHLEAEDIPVKLKGRVVDYPLSVDESMFSITCVSMGNPHTVISVDDVDGFPVGFYGPKIENNPIFPKRTNVEFIEVIDDNKLKMRVWERGAGETMACGTGASATVVASSLKGLTGRKAAVLLPGGELMVEWAENNHVYMTGPAVEVFEGEIEV